MRQQLTLLLSQDDGLEEIDSHALRLGHFGFYVDCDELIDFCLRAELGSKLFGSNLGFLITIKLHLYCIFNK